MIVIKFPLTSRWLRDAPYLEIATTDISMGIHERLPISPPVAVKISSGVSAAVGAALGLMGLYRTGAVARDEDRLMQSSSTITCPTCGHRETEAMPTDACQFFYECKSCGVLLKPKAGDCCVFCTTATCHARRFRKRERAAVRQAAARRQAISEAKSVETGARRTMQAARVTRVIRGQFTQPLIKDLRKAGGTRATPFDLLLKKGLSKLSP